MDVKELRQHLQPSSVCDANASAKLIEASALPSLRSDHTSGGRCDRHGEGKYEETHKGWVTVTAWGVLWFPPHTPGPQISFNHHGLQ